MWTEYDFVGTLLARCRVRWHRTRTMATTNTGAGPSRGKRALAEARAGVMGSANKPPRCGARCSDGHACRAPAVWLAGEGRPRNGRCRLHGGLSTGPKTAAGWANSLAALAKANAERREARAVRDAAEGSLATRHAPASTADARHRRGDE